jgi:hypothetical protein
VHLLATFASPATMRGRAGAERGRRSGRSWTAHAAAGPRLAAPLPLLEGKCGGALRASRGRRRRNVGRGGDGGE